jgi:hypothetical protein
VLPPNQIRNQIRDQTELTLSPEDDFLLPLKFLRCQSRLFHKFLVTNSESLEDRTSGAKALSGDIRAARLNPCPSLSVFFRKLFSRTVKD